MKRTMAVLLAGVLASGPVVAETWLGAYDGSALPSAPLTVTQAGTGTASSDGDILTIDTITGGQATAKYMIHLLNDAGAPDFSNSTVEMRLRQIDAWTVGFYLNMYDGTEWYNFITSPSSGFLAGDAGYTANFPADDPRRDLDVYEWHTYRFLMHDGQCDVYIDGVFYGTHSGVGASANDGFEIGDNSTSKALIGEVDFVRWSNAVMLPDPWLGLYDCSTLPPAPFTITQAGTGTAISDGDILTIDTIGGGQATDKYMAHLLNHWGAPDFSSSTVEMRLRQVAAWTVGFYLNMYDGTQWYNFATAGTLGFLTGDDGWTTGFPVDDPRQDLDVYEWHTYRFVMDGGQCKLWIDEVYYGAHSGVGANTADGFEFGDASTTKALTGEVDWVRWSNTAMPIVPSSVVPGTLVIVH